MDFLTFLSNAISTLAWPAVVVYALYLLRNKLGDLADRLRELSGPAGTKMTFSEGLTKATEKVEEIKVIEARDNKPIEGGANQTYTVGSEAKGEVAPLAAEDNRYLDLTTNHPEAAVLYAFKEVEDALLEYHRAYPKARSRSLIAIVNGLIDTEVLSPSYGELFTRLTSTRNAAVHAKGSPITTGEAVEYINLCRFMAEGVRKAIADLKNLPLPPDLKPDPRGPSAGGEAQ